MASSVTPVLIADHLEGGESGLADLSQQTHIPLERLEELQGGASPRMVEVAALSDRLDVSPIHLFRPAPSVQARRAGDGDTGALVRLLDEVDSFIATYAPDLSPNVADAFSARRYPHAMQHGISWGTRHEIRAYDPNADPLLRTIEHELSIPVVIWPVADAPAGATVDFSGTIGIWVNSYDQSGARQRFTLAHEVAHILLKHVDTGRGKVIVDLAADLDRPQGVDERLAGACASGILSDRETLNSMVGDMEPSPALAAHVAHRLGLSYQAALVSLKQHGFIDQDTMEKFGTVSAWQAFESAGAANAYKHFEEQRNQRRLPEILPNVERLGRALEQRLA